MQRVLRFRRRKRRKVAKGLPYESRRALLSRGEAAFYFALRAAIRGRYLIAFKVRLADLITCGQPAWKDGFGHLIARQHLDFVLCDPSSTEFLLAIELDDKSHALHRRKQRDTFVNKALAAAGITLIRFRAAARYDSTAISSAIENAL
jgi:hypothetical protein